MNCKFCNRDISNNGSLKAHEMCCKNNPDKIQHRRSDKAGRKTGCIPWNKGIHIEAKESLKQKIESGHYKEFTEYTIRKLVKKYLIEIYGYKCMSCGLSEWQNQSLPLVCDHIDGNHTNTNLDNFRIICNNCDSISTTFKGKNRGRGRNNRYESVRGKNEIL